MTISGIPLHPIDMKDVHGLSSPGTFCGVPVYINYNIGQVRLHRKVYRRRGYPYRPHKVVIKQYGRNPCIYTANSPIFGQSMIVNPEALAHLKQYEQYKPNPLTKVQAEPFHVYPTFGIKPTSGPGLASILP